MKDFCWNSLNSLLEENEGVAYIFEPEVFIENVNSLNTAFKSYYNNFRMGYSYKTNYLPRLCSIAYENGLYAEVVSGMEYNIAKKIGVKGEDIIFNGPGKSEAEIKLAFENNSLVNIDSLSECLLIMRLSKKLPNIEKRIGLRCNLDLKWGERESRFGLSEISGELDKVVQLLNTDPTIIIEGLHSHTSFDRSASSYKVRIKRLIQLADNIFIKNSPKFLDIGGGFFGPLTDEFAKELDISPPSYDDYAREICETLIDRYGIDGPELIIEPGVGLLANVFQYMYKVDHTKKISERWFAVTSGAAHQIKIVPNKVNLPTRVFCAPLSEEQGAFVGNEKYKIDIVGFTCLEHDIIFSGYQGELKRGDILMTSNVGAYSMVSSPDFIRTSPPVFEKTKEGWLKVRDKVTVEKLLSFYAW